MRDNAYFYSVCYDNTFAQFPVEDYAEVHVLDLRFFKGNVVEYAKEDSITRCAGALRHTEFCLRHRAQRRRICDKGVMPMQ